MQFSAMPELKEVVEVLKGKLSDLEHIEPDRILYASFSKKQSRTKARIGPVPQRFSIFLSDYEYLLEVHKESWLDASEGVRLYYILHELMHIPVEGFSKESKQYKHTVKHDLEDFKELVKVYGVDMENANKLVEKIR